VSNPFTTDEAQSYLLRCFVPEGADLARIRTWIQDNSSNNGTVFFRAQFIELAYWVAKWSFDARDDGRTFEK